jgi:hypothetical protein
MEAPRPTLLGVVLLKCHYELLKLVLRKLQQILLR